VRQFAFPYDLSLTITDVSNACAFIGRQQPWVDRRLFVGSGGAFRHFGEDRMKILQKAASALVLYQQ
jgi:hypothetical protein